MRFCLGLLVIILHFSDLNQLSAQEAKVTVGADDLTYLDIIPADAIAAIATRNVKQLQQRGDQLFEKADVDDSIRFSHGFQILVQSMRISKGVDQNGSFSVQIVSPPEDEDDLWKLLESLVVTVPIDDFDAMAENFSMPVARLKSGEVIDTREFDKGRQKYNAYVGVRGKHIYVGGREESVSVSISGERLTLLLDADAQKTFAEDDLMFILTSELYKLIGEDIPEFDEEWAKKEFGDDDANTVREIYESAHDFQRAICGVRIEDGFDLTLVVDFEGEKSKEILTKLSGQRSTSSLVGLPFGDLLIANSTGRQSDDHDNVSRIFFQLIMSALSRGQQAQLTATNRLGLAKILGLGFEQVNDTQSAIYLNDSPEVNGKFSLITILSVNDSEQFVEDMTSLVPFVNGAKNESDAAEAIDSRDQILSLIDDLDDPRYRVRELASTKLVLIGIPALSELSKAEENGNAETKLRAIDIARQITEAQKADQAEFVRGDFLSELDPQFSYMPEQEIREDVPVGVIRISSEAIDNAGKTQLAAFLGESWSEIRIVEFDGTVVLYLGSDMNLLERAIRNVKAEQVEPAYARQFGSFWERTGGKQQSEFHLALDSLLQIALDADNYESDRDESESEVTSMGIGFEPQKLRFDLVVPFVELRDVLRVMNR